MSSMLEGLMMMMMMMMMMKTKKKSRRKVQNLLWSDSKYELCLEEEEPDSKEGILQIVLSDIAVEEVQNPKEANRTYMEWIDSMSLIGCDVKYASQSSFCSVACLFDGKMLKVYCTQLLQRT